MKKFFKLFFISLLLLSCAHAQKDSIASIKAVKESAANRENYPTHWWKFYPDSQRHGSWEILPHEAKEGEVILSKRNELGVFSNFSYTPIYFEGERYASIEGLWQMMKYPNPKNKRDPRNKLSHLYPYTRDEVKMMDGFEAKRAGDAANKINKANGWNWVSYKKKKFNYKDHDSGSAYHYQIMKAAIAAKVYQNKEVKELLEMTKGLILKPDHSQGSNPPPSYKYHDILMKIRKKL